MLDKPDPSSGRMALPIPIHFDKLPRSALLLLCSWVSCMSGCWPKHYHDIPLEQNEITDTDTDIYP